MSEHIKHLFTCARGHVYELRIHEGISPLDRIALCQQAAGMEYIKNSSDSEDDST